MQADFGLSCGVDATCTYDIAIIGAGPAGATCALALRDAGLRVVLLDKAAFPRDKVCGDAIPARAARVLRELSPMSAQALADLPAKTTIHGCKVVSPSGQAFRYQFQTAGYCARRFDFDAFLVNEVRALSQVDFMPATTVQRILRVGEFWELQTSAGLLKARFILGCDGANGVTARQLTGFELDPQHHCAAVRAYYAGVSGLQPDTMEIHLLADWLPGYFWIFPVGAGECNVGFGMLSAHIAQRKLALRPALTDIIAQTPALAARFADAEMLGKVQGFGLPLGSRWVQLHGEGYLLCGDAASLIDPATGEGIGNAMWSAQIAAKWAIDAFRKNDFGQTFLQGYAAELHAKLGKEFRQKYYAQRLIGDRTWLLDWLIGRAGKKGFVNWLARKVF
jgi:menaquinone-9 beta-reductase